MHSARVLLFMYVFHSFISWKIIRVIVNVFRFDFIIVGAGVAGPIIARRLSDNPWRKILLIEAGPEEPTMTAIPGFAFSAVNTSLDWNFKTEPTLSHPTACLGIKYHFASYNLMSCHAVMLITIIVLKAYNNDIKNLTRQIFQFSKS